MTERARGRPGSEGEPLNSIYERITVGAPTVVSARPAPAAYAHGLSLALPQAVMARPTGIGRAISTYTIAIEGRIEWLAAARRWA